MSRRPFVPIALIITSVALVFAMAWSLDHFRRYQPYAGLLSSNDTGDRPFALQLNDVQLRGRSGGHPQWSVHASKVTLLPDQTNISIETIDHGLLMNGAHPYLRFAAQRAAYALGAVASGTGIVTITGGIHIESVAGAAAPISSPIAIATPSAVWNGYQSLLTLPENVDVKFGKTATTPAMEVDAHGANWSGRTRQLVCPGSVVATIESTTGGGPYRISSHDLTYNEQSGQVLCSVPVSLDVPALGDATCRPLTVDTHAKTVDFSNVHILAHLAAIITPDSGGDSSPKPPSSDQSTAKPDDANNNVTVDAPQGGHWDEQDRTLTVRGPVTFHQGDAAMATVGAIYDRKTDIAHAQSPVTITDPETTVTGKAGDVDFKKHIATLSGNVHVDIEPKPDKGSSDDDSSAKSEAKQPSTMTCDAIVYNYKTKFAITNGTVVIKQEHRTVTADKGTYDVKTHIAELTGNMVATSDDGKVLKAEYAKVSVKKGDEWIDIPHPTEMLIPVNPDDNPRNTK